MAETVFTGEVRTDAFTMAYFRFGQGKEPLVILPGLSVQSVMGAADAVAGAYAPLTNDFTIYVFDRRRELPATYPVDEMARDTAAALRALGLGRVCLFGASQGGMMALVTAIRYPALVKRLVVGSSCARVTEERFRTVETWIRLAKAREAENLYLAFGEAIYPKAVFEGARAYLTAAARGVTNGELDRFIVLAEGMRGFDVTGELAHIDCPGLVIDAADDRVMGPDASEEIAAAAGFSRYRYESGGHAVYDTAPDYKERLRAFFTERQAGT